MRLVGRTTLRRNGSIEGLKRGISGIQTVGVHAIQVELLRGFKKRKSESEER
jgi:hypothetical protein